MPQNLDTTYWSASLRPGFGSGFWTFRTEDAARGFAASPRGQAMVYRKKPLIDECWDEAFGLALNLGLKPGRVVGVRKTTALLKLTREVRQGKFHHGLRSALETLAQSVTGVEEVPATPIADLIELVRGRRITAADREAWSYGYVKQSTREYRVSYLMVGLILADRHLEYRYRP